MRIQPKFKGCSRVFVTKDCLRLYFDEKEKLKSLLCAYKQVVSLTTDTWTSIQNMNYRSLTYHSIDGEWTLKMRIFELWFNIVDHNGETIGINIENCMKE